MYTTILLGHILIAILTLSTATKATVMTHRSNYQAAKTNLAATWVALGATAVSGLGLAALAPGAFGRLCLSMVATVVVVSLANIYYRRQVRLASAL